MDIFYYICNELIFLNTNYMNETTQRLLNLFKTKPYSIEMGAGRISKWQHCSIEEVKQARIIYYNSLKQETPKSRTVNILVLDIETSPLKAYVWSRWRQNIYLDQTISEWFMLCWSAKWLGEEEVFGERLNAVEVAAENDKRIVTSLWKLLDEADIVIAHNSKRFDIPKMNSRFLLNELPPPSPYKQIDTKEVSAKQFGFSSNKLDALLIYFGEERKFDTDFEIWVKCMNGDEEALEYMLTYNKKDVTQLEKVYLKLRPYIKGHPNLGVYSMIEDNQCGHCGSTSLIANGTTYTNISQYSTYRCTSCGAISRTRTTTNTINKRKKLLTTIN